MSKNDLDIVPSDKKVIGNWAIRCKGCGLIITVSDTTIHALETVVIRDGWLIGDGYQHCPVCRIGA